MRRLYKAWRVLATGFSFSVFGLGTFTLALLLTVLVYPLPIPSQKKRSFTRYIVSFAAWFYVRMMWCLGLLSFGFSNQKALNQPGQLVVANHPTLLDAVFMMSVMPRTTCIVKAAMWRNPFTAAMVRLAGYIPNSDNGEELVEKAVQAIESGQTLIIFPEGTRTAKPESLNFRRGAANIAVKSNCTICPVLISCEPLTLRKHVPWYRVPERRPHWQIAVQGALAVADCVDTSRPQSLQARALNRHLEHYISSRLPTFAPGSSEVQ
jgi:1-acyl-sn-glycerol-3-phosphate acyltransferase